jgi:host factor-I protein
MEVERGALFRRERKRVELARRLQPSPRHLADAFAAENRFAGSHEKMFAGSTRKMPKDNIHRLQDTFLDHLLRRRTPVTIFLANGVRLQGVVAGYDAFCVLLERDGEQQIVYKHSITTTVPAYPVDLREDSDAPAPAAPPVTKIGKPTLIVERKGQRRPLR